MSTTQEKLTAAVTRLRDYGDEIDKKDAGPSGEELAELKNRMTEVKDLKAQVEAEATAKGELDEARAFMKALSGTSTDEVKSAKVTYTDSGLPTDTKGKTFGELFVGSPAYEQFTKDYVRNGIVPNGTKGIRSAPFQADAKALITGASSTSAGAFVVNDRYGPITDLVGDRELTLADIVTRATTQSDTIEYVRVTAKTNNAAPVAEATSSAGPTYTVESSGDDVTVTPATGGGYKPESAATLEVVSTPVVTIAHWIPMTKRSVADAGQVRAFVDTFLTYGLNEELEDQILNGSGSGANMTGILNSSPQTTGSAGTDIDAIVDAIRKVRVTGRRKPTALVIHPNDWYSTGFLLAKTGDGTNSAANYLIGDPRASVDQLNTLWGLNVVVTEAMTENTALVGDFRQSVLWQREPVSISVSDQHSDFFIRNLLAVLAEMRAGFGVLDPQAFCTVTSI